MCYLNIHIICSLVLLCNDMLALCHEQHIHGIATQVMEAPAEGLSLYNCAVFEIALWLVGKYQM